MKYQAGAEGRLAEKRQRVLEGAEIGGKAREDGQRELTDHREARANATIEITPAPRA